MTRDDFMPMFVSAEEVQNTTDGSVTLKNPYDIATMQCANDLADLLATPFDRQIPGGGTWEDNGVALYEGGRPSVTQDFPYADQGGPFTQTFKAPFLVFGQSGGKPVRCLAGQLAFFFMHGPESAPGVPGVAATPFQRYQADLAMRQSAAQTIKDGNTDI